MARKKHPEVNPSHPFCGYYYASPALAAHYGHCTHSNKPIANEYAQKHTIQYCVGLDEMVWSSCTRYNKLTSSNCDKKHNPKLILWFRLIPYHHAYNRIPALGCVVYTESGPRIPSLQYAMLPEGNMADKKSAKPLNWMVTEVQESK